MTSPRPLDLGYRRGAPRRRPADRRYRSQCAVYGPAFAGQAFDLLGRIIPTRPITLGRLDLLTVDDPRRRAGFTIRRLARLQQQR